MGFTEPDSAPAEPPQMPQASTPGPAPAPYTGPDELGQVHYAATGVTFHTPGPDVLASAEGGPLQESAYAHDVNAGLVVPFFPGSISPVQAHGDADAGGRDDVSGTVAGAVAASEARYMEHEGDTHGAGSTIGDPLDLPLATPGNFGGAYYDPPRDYGAH